MRQRISISYNTGPGEMAERTKAPVSKTGMGATSSWVRIPLSPPLSGTKPPYCLVSQSLRIPHITTNCRHFADTIFNRPLILTLRTDKRSIPKIFLLQTFYLVGKS